MDTLNLVESVPFIHKSCLSSMVMKVADDLIARSPKIAPWPSMLCGIGKESFPFAA